MATYQYTIAYSCDCVKIDKIIKPTYFYNKLNRDQFHLLNPHLKLINYYSHGIIRVTFTCEKCFRGVNYK